MIFQKINQINTTKSSSQLMTLPLSPSFYDFMEKQFFCLIVKNNKLRLCRLWSDDPGSCPFSISAKCYGPVSFF